MFSFLGNIWQQILLFNEFQRSCYQFIHDIISKQLQALYILFRRFGKQNISLSFFWWWCWGDGLGKYVT